MNGYTLLGDHRSGNCYKVALIMKLTDTPFRWVETDVLRGETRSEAFLSINPNGKVPLLQLPDGSWLAESNAMLIHLAEGTRFLPEDGLDRARVFQWLFFEQYSHEPYLAVARFLLQFEHGRPVDPQHVAMLQSKARSALGVMETVLVRQPFMACEEFTIADIALYAYTHVADEGGVSLEGFPAVRRWLGEVASQSGHFDMAALAA